MSIEIIVDLDSNPGAVLPDEPATLFLTLHSTLAPAQTEMATVAFELTDADYTFAENGKATLTKQVLVGTNTPFSVPYSLKGPTGPRGVTIRVAATPNEPPSRSATQVVIKEQVTAFTRMMGALGLQ
jgi:hypothetical protein